MPEKTFRQVCKCENCGNEAEMQVTCSLEFDENVVVPAEDKKPEEKAEPKKRVPGQAVCSHCGNEADIWVGVE